MIITCELSWEDLVTVTNALQLNADQNADLAEVARDEDEEDDANELELEEIDIRRVLAYLRTVERYARSKGIPLYSDN